MRLTILGSGTCVPTVKRGSPANLLEINGTKILLDMGPGSLRQLARVNPSLYRDIDIVYFSHHHTDHVADFAPFIQALNWTPGFIRKKDLSVVGHPALKKILREILGKAIFFNIKFIPLGRKTRVKNIVFEAIPGRHVPTSLVLKVMYNQKTLVYAADSDFNPAMVNFAKHCDVLMIENSFPGKTWVKGHMNAHLNAQLANLIQPKRLLLTHLYPPCDKYDIKKQVSRLYKGSVIIAKDLMTVTI